MTISVQRTELIRKVLKASKYEDRSRKVLPKGDSVLE